MEYSASILLSRLPNFHSYIWIAVVKLFEDATLAYKFLCRLGFSSIYRDEIDRSKESNI